MAKRGHILLVYLKKWIHKLRFIGDDQKKRKEKKGQKGGLGGYEGAYSEHYTN